VRENLSLLSPMYNDHFRTLQESGLEPKAPQNVKVEQSGEVFHHRFPFLKTEEAARLRKTEEDIDAGRIDVVEPRGDDHARGSRVAASVRPAGCRPSADHRIVKVPT
jgi:hypothetical protein